MKLAAFERHLAGAPVTHLTCLVLVIGCTNRAQPAPEPPMYANGVGRECQVAAAGAMSAPTALAINTAAPECASGVCVLPPLPKNSDTLALCTDLCVTDADCLGGQRRDPKAAADHRCVAGFTCRALIPNISVPFACERLCVCKDFLLTNGPDTPPAGCT